MLKTMSRTTADAATSATEQAMARVAELDFTMLKKKLALQKRWPAAFIAETEQHYRQFLTLILLYPDKKISPTHAIDEFWHAHILDTRAYAADCEALFGEYRHHYPYSGLNGVFDEMMNQGIQAESRALFKQHFGIDPFEDRAAHAKNISAMRASVAAGVRVEGIDLARDRGAAVIARLRELLLEHHVLVLPGQRLSALELADFGRQWGDLYVHSITPHPDTDQVQRVVSKRKFSFFSAPFAGGWHADMTWLPAPPVITGLHAQQLPKIGGDTAFANQHLAYETLDENLRSRLDDLEAFHTGKGFGTEIEDSVHPMVRVHEETGRKALFVNTNYTRHIVGLPDDESERLLFRLFGHATRPEFTYRHRWQRNDLVLWDNRSVMHYAIGDYDEPRVMHRIVVKDGEPS